MSEEQSSRQRSEIRNSNERQQAESIIHSVATRSKRLGRGLAVLAVAAGIALGVSNKADEPQVIASEITMVGSMAAVGLNERRARRRCNNALDEYAAALRQGVGLAAPLPEADNRSDNGLITEPTSKIGRFINKTSRPMITFGAALMPFMATLGTAQAIYYSEEGGPVLPQHFLNGSQNYEAGIMMASMETAMGLGFMCLSGAGTVSEKTYLQRLDEIDGTSETDPSVGVVNDQPISG